MGKLLVTFFLGMLAFAFLMLGGTAVLERIWNMGWMGTSLIAAILGLIILGIFGSWNAGRYNVNTFGNNNDVHAEFHIHGQSVPPGPGQIVRDPRSMRKLGLSKPSRRHSSSGTTEV